MGNMAFDWKKALPISWPRLLLAVFIPSAIAWEEPGTDGKKVKRGRLEAAHEKVLVSLCE